MTGVQPQDFDLRPVQNASISRASAGGHTLVQAVGASPIIGHRTDKSLPRTMASSRNMQILSRAIGVGGLGLAALVVWMQFRSLDSARVVEVLGRAGYMLPLALVPFAVASIVDTLGWAVVLRAFGYPTRFELLLRLRVACEAVVLAAPGGSVLAEGVRPVVLNRAAGVPYPAGIASVVLRKWLIFVANGIYLACGLVGGFAIYRGASVALIGRDGLEHFAVAVVAAFLAGSLGSMILLTRAHLSERLFDFLSRLPFAGLAKALAGARDGFMRLDGYLHDLLAKSRGAFATALGFIIALWFAEALETWVLLRLVGVELNPLDALAVESGASFVRSLTFFVPAGLGFQDVTYARLLGSLNIPDALEVSAAFVLLKRIKEIIWIVIGFVLFASLRRAFAVSLQPVPAEEVL